MQQGFEGIFAVKRQRHWLCSGIALKMKKTVLDINVRIEEIRKALTNKMYLSAISLALTVPDICGRIENATGDDKEKLYSMG